MPMSYTCVDHPAFEADVLDGVTDHLAEAHNDITRQKAFQTVITHRYSSQPAAHGRTEVRIFRCRSCGKLVTVNENVTNPRCRECQ